MFKAWNGRWKTGRNKSTFTVKVNEFWNVNDFNSHLDGCMLTISKVNFKTFYVFQFDLILFDLIWFDFWQRVICNLIIEKLCSFLGEWGAFNEIIKRKDSSISNQVATLQMKIVTEDKAVESRTNDFFVDWEKARLI